MLTFLAKDKYSPRLSHFISRTTFLAATNDRHNNAITYNFDIDGSRSFLLFVLCVLDQRVFVVLLKDDVVLPPVDPNVGGQGIVMEVLGHLLLLLLLLLLDLLMALLRCEVRTEGAFLLEEALLEVKQAAVLVLAKAIPEGKCNLIMEQTCLYVQSNINVLTKLSDKVLNLNASFLTLLLNIVKSIYSSDEILREGRSPLDS